MKTFIAGHMLHKVQRELWQALNEDESYSEGISFIGKVYAISYSVLLNQSSKTST